MTHIASEPLFGALIILSIGGAVAAALILGGLLIRDWKRGQLW